MWSLHIWETVSGAIAIQGIGIHRASGRMGLFLKQGFFFLRCGIESAPLRSLNNEWLMGQPLDIAVVKYWSTVL